MAARAAIAGLMRNDAELQVLGFTTDTIFGANALDGPPTASGAELPDSIFMVIRIDDHPKAFRSTGPYSVTVWVHLPKHRTRDYSKIDNAQLRIQEIMEAAEHVAGSDGWILTSATWDGTSGDLFDEGYKTLARWSRYRVACRPAVTP